jgi:hypothetical protein
MQVYVAVRAYMILISFSYDWTHGYKQLLRGY